MKLVIAEKPSVAQSIAKVIGANKREDGYLEGNGYLVSWCVGHLVELAPPAYYDEKYEKWRYEDLPILPGNWIYQVSDATKNQFNILKQLMHRDDVTEIVNSCDSGSEGDSESTTSPKTSDDANLFYPVLMLTSALALTGIVVNRKRRNN